MMTDKQPSNEDIRKWLDDVKFHRNSPTSKYLRILLDRLESAERRDVVTPEYLQSWIDRAYEAESRIRELEVKLAKADLEDKAAMHDIEHLTDSLNFELNRADNAESRIKELESVLNEIAESMYCADGYRNVSISEDSADKLKTILEQNGD